MEAIHSNRNDRIKRGSEISSTQRKAVYREILLKEKIWGGGEKLHIRRQLRLINPE